MTRQASEMVAEFHKAFYLSDRLNTTDDPYPLSSEEEQLRLDLLEEEFSEYLQALYESDRVALADALGDMLYIIHGTALAYGFDLDAVLEEIHRSNMTKLGEDGKPLYREDGKVLKGPNYEPPNIAGVLDEQER